MVFHLPWCAAFSISICLHLLLDVGGRGVLLVCHRAEVVAFWHPFLLLACGGHCDDAGVVFMSSVFSLQLSTPGKSLCLCLLFEQRCWNGMLEVSGKLNSSGNVLFRKKPFKIICIFYIQIELVWDIHLMLLQLSFTVSQLTGSFFSTKCLK